MRIKIIIFCLIVCLLTGCTSVVDIARYIHDSDKIDDYIYSEAVVVNKYIEKIVEALNTNDRELLASLFPEHARSKIDNFDEKIDRIIRENESWPWPSSIIRYKLNEDNNYQSRADRGKIYKEVYANTTIEFADPKEGEVHRPSLKIAMVIVPVDDFMKIMLEFLYLQLEKGSLLRMMWIKKRTDMISMRLDTNNRR